MPAEKFQNKYRIASSRLQDWDYGSRAFYHITICTLQHQHYFGQIVETQNFASLRETPIGKIARENWFKIPEHFPFVELDEFVLMPDHLHGLIFFNVPMKNSIQTNQFGPQRKNLASVIRGYKASVKSHATRNNIDFAWQARYYDSVITNKNAAERVRRYIKNNPQKWINDHSPKHLSLP